MQLKTKVYSRKTTILSKENYCMLHWNGFYVIISNDLAHHPGW